MNRAGVLIRLTRREVAIVRMRDQWRFTVGIVDRMNESVGLAT
jgi:hypothetical protein